MSELSKHDREKLRADKQRRAALKIDKIHHDLNKMLTYGEKLKKASAAEAKSKGDLLVNHAINLKTMLNNRYENGQLKNNFQKDFITELNKHNALLNQHREVKQIITAITANIALFLIGAGVFYALAVATRCATGGPGFFFTRTTSRELVARVEERVNYYRAPGYFVSEKELAQREINSQVTSNMYDHDMRERQLGLFGVFNNFP